MAEKQEAKGGARMSLSAGLRKGLANEAGDVEARLDAHTDRAGDRAYRAEQNTNTASVRPRLRLQLNELVSNPFNPRRFYSPESIDALAVELKRDGQYQAIAVTQLASYPGKYVIVDGERRTLASKSLGDEFIDGEIFNDLSPRDLYLIANRINKQRQPQTIFDDAVAWSHLLNEKVYPDQDALAEAVGATKATVSKVLSLNSIPMSLLRRMSEEADKVGLRSAYNLRLLFERKGEGLTEQCLERLVNGELSASKLEELVARHRSENDALRRTKSHYNSRVHFSNAAGEQIGELKRFIDGRTEFKISGITGELQAKLSERIESAVRGFLDDHPEQNAREGAPSSEAQPGSD
ncbi:ParB/RepB/Spo0J family partition protein [Paraburkholderia domus]|uniref:ParB/RepB/Spo0J family partition protein n=1 Tax=Paraburkholderia domus TaxID=2793075 RepID=UPI001912DF54|nr:ParB/RepB/Spo0J family partition protein [Paraburkholderia domus]MBK5064790.1 ParB/RepB/Spo0J family partition protein [Burkholderia sp. R-70199]CAE6956394.1 Nucleoid occlusion protein [Paraburkholderia domus]